MHLSHHQVLQRSHHYTFLNMLLKEQTLTARKVRVSLEAGTQALVPINSEHGTSLWKDLQGSSLNKFKLHQTRTLLLQKLMKTLIKGQ